MLTSFIATPPALAQTKALELIQVHLAGGRQKLYVTKDAFRLEHERTGIIVISKRPFTTAFVVNPAKKTCVRKITSKLVKTLLQTQIIMISDNPLSEEPWSKTEPTKLAGVDTLTYRRENRKGSWCREWVLKQPALPDNAVDLICAFSSALPSLHGVPMQEQLYYSFADSPHESYEKGKRLPFLMFDTKSSKNVTVADSLFEPPKDYVRPNAKTRAMPETPQVELTKEMFKSPDFLFQTDTRKIESTPRKNK